MVHPSLSRRLEHLLDEVRINLPSIRGEWALVWKEWNLNG
jgi:hypothetical protein